MANNTNTKVKVTYYYDEKGLDILEILRNSVLLFVEREVRKLCETS